MTNSYYACILHFILHMCVKIFTRVHAWSDATRVFCICTRVSHACDMRGLFKLWVICTVCHLKSNLLGLPAITALQILVKVDHMQAGDIYLELGNIKIFQDDISCNLFPRYY